MPGVEACFRMENIYFTLILSEIVALMTQPNTLSFHGSFKITHKLLLE